MSRVAKDVQRIHSPRMKVLFTNQLIKQKIHVATGHLAQEYRGLENVTIISIFNGAFYFGPDMADALFERGINPFITTMQLSSYGNDRQSRGHADIVCKPDYELVTNHDVIVVEDLIETGTTTKYLLEDLSEHNPNSVHFVFAVQKGKHNIPKQLEGRVTVLFPEVPKNLFLVGYGMDLEGRFRPLKDICYVQE